MADYYLDVDYSDLTLTGTLDFTNGSTTVTGTGTLFTTELAVGDYIRSTDATNGGTWYKVASITDDLTLDLSVAFQEASHTGATAERNRGDGSQTAPFCTIQQFLVDIALAAGDRLFAQLGQRNIIPAKIALAADGTAHNPIQIIGSDWKNSGATGYFTIDANGYSFTPLIDAYGDIFYLFDTIEIANYNNASYGAIYFRDSILKFKNCKFTNNVSNVFSSYFPASGTVICVNCIFDTNNTINRDAFAILQDCSFVSNTYLTRGGHTLLINPSGIDPISGYTEGPFTIVTKGINGGSPAITVHNVYEIANNSLLPPYISNGYYDDVAKEFKNDLTYSSVEDTTFTFSSGNTAIKIIPTANDYIGPEFPACVAEWTIDNVVAGTYTVTVLVQTSGVTVFPTSDELYIEVEYLNDATNPTVGFVRSTEAITADATETSLTASFTSAQDGRVRVRVMYGYNNGTDTDPIIYVENGFTIA